MLCFILTVKVHTEQLEHLGHQKIYVTPDPQKEDLFIYAD